MQSQVLAPPFPVFKERREWIRIIPKPFIMELFNTLFITELKTTFGTWNKLLLSILGRMETEAKIKQAQLPCAFFFFFLVGKQYFSEKLKFQWKKEV